MQRKHNLLGTIIPLISINIKGKMLILTSLASITVPTPTVRAIVGTFDKSPSKYLAFAKMVSIARVFNLVLDTKLDPGSLKAI